MRKQNQRRDPGTTQMYLSFASRKKRNSNFRSIWSRVSFQEEKGYLPFPNELLCFLQV